MTRETIRSGDATLSARIDGAAGKPWLLVSNSLAADHSMWDDQIALFTKTHRVVRYDTRGHGESAAPLGPYSFSMLVEDMRAVMDHVGANEAEVLGLSLGGMTALGFALTYPARVRKLAVCDARADAPEPFVKSWDDRMAAVDAGGMNAVVEGTLQRWFTAKCGDGPKARAARMIRETSVAGYKGCAAALKQLNYLQDLPRMRPPVYYVVGEEDLGAPKDAVAAMAAATPQATLAVLPGLAHIPNMENPAAFAAALEPWLEGRG